MGKGESGTAKPYLRGKIWWIKYYLPDGSRKYESSGSENRSDAVKLLNERRAGADAGKVIAANPTVAQILELVVADYKMRRKPNLWNAGPYKESPGPGPGKVQSPRRKQRCDQAIHRSSAIREGR
jgi:hypothetical protein